MKTNYSVSEKMRKLLSCVLVLGLFCGTISIGTVSPLSPAVTVEAATIKLNATSKTLYKNGTYTLKVSGTSKTVSWSSSNKSIATVTSKGKVTAKKAGTCYIYAKVSGKTLKCKVTVKNPSPKISATSKTYYKGGSFTLAVSGTADTVKWSSSKTSVATVTSAGKITRKAKGTCYIYAKVNGKTLKCKLTVVNPTLSASTLTLVKGKTSTLKITGGSGTVTWSSSKTSVATVSSAEKVTAKATGTATISAKVNGKTMKCVVTVQNPSLSATTLSLAKGETSLLTVKNNTQSVTWSSSNTSVATVNSLGKVTAVSAGTATITAKVTGKSMTCKVTVTEDIAITSISIDQTLLLIGTGETGQLTATISPSNTTMDKTVEWLTYNSAVATVDSNGVVTGVKEGSTMIMARSSNGLVSLCTVTVSDPAVEESSISLNQTSMTIRTGQIGVLKATVTRNGKVSDETITWSSSKTSVATIDSNGVITPVKAGTAVMTATTSDSLKVTCTVKVISTTDLISDTGMTLKVGKSDTISLNTGSASDYTWSSSNTSILTVASNGKVTGVSTGVATVTVTDSDGNKDCLMISVVDADVCSEHDYETIKETDTYIMYECGDCGLVKVSYGSYEETTESRYQCNKCGLYNTDFDSDDLFYLHCYDDVASYKTVKVTYNKWIETSFIEIK